MSIPIMCTCLGAGVPHDKGDNPACTHWNGRTPEDKGIPKVEETPSIVEQLDKERPIGLMTKEQIINELIRSQMSMLERQELFKLRHYLLELRCNEFRNKQAAQSGLLPPDEDGGNYTPAWVQ